MPGSSIGSSRFVSEYACRITFSRVRSLPHCGLRRQPEPCARAVDRLVAAGAQERRTQDLLRVGINEDLHEPFGLALLECAGHVLHSDLPNQGATAALAYVRLGHPGTSEWRIGIERIGGNPIA